MILLAVAFSVTHWILRSVKTVVNILSLTVVFSTPLDHAFFYKSHQHIVEKFKRVFLFSMASSLAIELLLLYFVFTLRMKFNSVSISNLRKMLMVMVFLFEVITIAIFLLTTIFTLWGFPRLCLLLFTRFPFC